MSTHTQEKTTNLTPLLVGREQLGELWGIGLTEVDKVIRERGVRSTRRGRRVLVPYSDAIAWAERQVEGAK